MSEVDGLVLLGIVGLVAVWLLYAVADARASDGLAGAAMFVVVTVLALVGVFGLMVLGALWGHWLWQWAAGAMGVVVAAALWALWEELK